MTDEQKEAREWFKEVATQKARQNGSSKWLMYEDNGLECYIEATYDRNAESQGITYSRQ